jgi:hypothetical protein
VDAADPLFYCDDPEIVATVMIDGRPIKLKASDEFNAFVNSVMLLDPEPMLQQAVWIEQMSHCVEAGVRCDTVVMHVWGKTIVPAATLQAHEFVETLYNLDRAPRCAVAVLLKTLSRRFFQIAATRDRSIIPGEI